MADINLGHATAYGYARSKGFSGTEEEFAQLMANYGTIGQTATQAAQTATTKASEAASSASNAALSATNAANSAQEAADIVENIIDNTLTHEGKAADAKVTGDRIGELRDDFGDIVTFDTQFVDMSTAMSNKRYEVTSVTVIDGTGYFALPKISLKAGTYYFSDLVANFCHYIYSGQSTLNNFSGSGKISGSITFDSDADVYLTGNASYGNIMFANNILPETYLYGNYNFTPKDGLVVIDNTLTKNGVGADAKTIGNTLGVNGYQYVDESKIVENYRYEADGSKTPTASTGYFILPMIALKAGTYYFRNIYTDFTAIENAETKALVSLKTFVGSGRVTDSVTIDYDFNLYVTGNLSFDTLVYGKVVWADYPIDSLGNDRVYGIFGIRADSRRYQEKVNSVFTVEKDGTGDFTTIKSALETAVVYPNSIVKVGQGTFDLIDEFGADYFANLDAVGNSGLQLYNDITVEFTSNTLATCHYAGSNENVMRYFSPFNLNKTNGRPGGFTLKNLHLECSNVRYGVHDESNASNTSYCNKYLNCVMKVDNRNNTAFSARQCIGGGLGSSSEIIIKDCIFESVVNEGTAGTGIVSYHNGGTGRSDIIIKDCYFKGNDTVKASWHGTSTKVSTMTVSGCSMGMNPYNQAETSGDTVENMELITWNNEIRTA